MLEGYQKQIEQTEDVRKKEAWAGPVVTATLVHNQPPLPIHFKDLRMYREARLRNDQKWAHTVPPKLAF